MAEKSAAALGELVFAPAFALTELFELLLLLLTVAPAGLELLLIATSVWFNKIG